MRRIRLRYILPLVVASICALMLFVGWVPYDPEATIAGLRTESLTVQISPEELTKIQDEWASRRESHPFLSRLHREKSQWYWIESLNGPAFWCAIPLDIIAQSRGEEVGLYSISSAREMLVMFLVGIPVWYFVGFCADEMIATRGKLRPRRPWSAVVLVSFIFVVATSPMVVICAGSILRQDEARSVLLPAGISWAAIILGIGTVRVRQVIGWRRSGRGVRLA